ncbi:hypothetical protein CCAX7_20150 [Capsulimonas corticalis]|uniref:Uncharacterized protein n=1 Tax=Capsulimonas corticalis TaxID=2219043 RepID=A0A402D2J8_9BACT|nr:tetratricopeptide repeat protein [Capsulimonas corticalis]BDI29964.1 hypothetical protein CCAX7_20150 [Capsulimonas corticalis]
MKLRPALIASVIGIYALSIAASIYVGVRLAGHLPALLSSGGSPYFQIWNRGDRYSELGNYGAAIREYDKMIAMRPNKVEGYTYRAIAEYHAGLYDRSIQDDTTGIALLNRREGILEQGAPAGMTYQDQLESVPNSQARLYRNRGAVYAKLGDITQATRDFKQAIALEPDEPAYYGALSSLYRRTQQYGLDASNWKDATVNVPDSAYCWTYYGRAQYQLGNISEAVLASLRAMHLDPKLAAPKFNLALCYAVRDQWDLAEPIYREAIALGDSRAQANAVKMVRNGREAHPNSQALRKAEALLGSP